MPMARASASAASMPARCRNLPFVGGTQQVTARSPALQAAPASPSDRRPSLDELMAAVRPDTVDRLQQAVRDG